MCPENFPTGKTLPIRASSTQDGADVRGFLTMGQVVTEAGGNTIRNGVLTFQATVFNDGTVRNDVFPLGRMRVAARVTESETLLESS